MTTDEQEDSAEGDRDLIRDTFEPRRQAIISEFTSGDEKYNDPDEHTEYDLEALISLQCPILALLKHEPKDRATVREAMNMIEWVDHRRGSDGDEEEREYEDTNENE